MKILATGNEPIENLEVEEIEPVIEVRPKRENVIDTEPKPEPLPKSKDNSMSIFLVVMVILVIAIIAYLNNKNDGNK